MDKGTYVSQIHFFKTKKALLTMVVYFEAVVCKYDLAIRDEKERWSSYNTKRESAHTKFNWSNGVENRNPI